LVHQPDVSRQPLQQVQAVEISLALAHEIAILQTIVVNAGGSKRIAGEKETRTFVLH
jgi:hypothetical protein